MSNKKSISYRQVGDYLIPNLILPPEEANVALGKWGMMHKDYLQKNKKVFFNTLLMQGKMYQYCAEVEKQAKEMFEFLIKQIKVSEAVTKEMKGQKQWSGCRYWATFNNKQKKLYLMN